MNPEDTLYSRAPGRIDLAGAGTDLSPYREEHGGQVLSAALRIHAYAMLVPRLDGRVNLHRLQDGEEFTWRQSRNLPLEGPLAPIQALVNRMELDRGFDLTLSCDVPHSSGLALEAATGVATLAVLEEFAGRLIPKVEVGQLYFEVNGLDLGKPVMQHEPFVSVWGGICDIDVYGEKIERQKSQVKESVRMSFEALGILVSTGEALEMGYEEISEMARASDREGKKLQNRLKAAAQSARDALAAGDLYSFTTFLDEDWQLYRQLFPELVSPRIERLMDVACQVGSRGGKRCGLNGDCLFFSCDNLEIRHRLIEALKSEGCTMLPFQLDEIGVEVWRQPQINS